MGLGQAPLHPVLPNHRGPLPTPAPQHGHREGADQDRQVGVQESSWGGPTANSQQQHLVPSSAGDTSPVPSAPAAGGMEFRALQAKGLRPVSLGRGAGGAGVGDRGQKQSQQHRQHFTGRAAPQAGRGERAKPGGHGGRQEGRAPRHHCGSAFRMAFTSSATAVSANSNWSWRSRRGCMRGPASPALGAAHGPGGRGALVWGWGSTLVCTMPGRWSRMCSSVAAMSISFTPGTEGERGARRGGQQAWHMASHPPNRAEAVLPCTYLWPFGSGPCR